MLRPPHAPRLTLRGVIGFSNLAGGTPCTDCGSDSGDCDWLTEAARCSTGCRTCSGTAVARCGHCDEVVPCGAELGRNPRPDATCAWNALTLLHAEDCPWTRSHGGELEPLPPRLTAVR